MATGDQTDIFSRLKGYLPTRWFGSRADTPDDVDGVMTGAANALAFLYSLYSYAKLQTRINTATDGWLDLIAADFFGSRLPRNTGQSDDSYRNAIKAQLLREKATRNAVTLALTALTGRAPTIIEPTKPNDTGAYAPNPRATLAGASIYRTDWQGRQLLYPTARTNLWPNASDNLSGAAFLDAVQGQQDPRGTSDAILNTFDTATGARLFGDFSLKGNGVYSWGLWALAVAGSTVGQLQAIVKDKSTDVVRNAGQMVSINETSWTFIPVYGTVATAGANAGARIELQAFTSSGVQTSGASAKAYLFGASIYQGSSIGSYIQNTTAPVTVTDYTNNGDGTITVAQPVDGVTATLSTYSPADGLPDGSPLSPVYSSHTLFTTTLPMTGPFAPVGYGAAGAYGSLSLPYQAFVIAYRPHSAQGIANVAGYGISTAGYSEASWGEYAKLSDATGGVLDSDIFAAVAAVKPKGTIVWTTIQN